MAEFKTSAAYQPTGDQPDAIATLSEGLRAGERYQTLLGATGTGKTATMAWIIEEVGKPALLIAHNKTLAAQLCNELREFFPNNAVEYFVSYYDYYQPEAYVPQADLYIEKDSSQNDDIARLRPLPGQGRRGRGAAGQLGDRVQDLLLRRRGRADQPLRPAHGRDLRAPRQRCDLAGNGVRHVQADDRARRRRDPPRARAAGQAVRVGEPAARGPPDPPTHRIRPGDAAGAWFLQRDRELLAAPGRPCARHAPVHAARLLPLGLRC